MVIRMENNEPRKELSYPRISKEYKHDKESCTIIYTHTDRKLVTENELRWVALPHILKNLAVPE